MFLFEFVKFEWQLVANHAIQLLFAYLLALPIGWEREQSRRRFGLRTFPLVAVVTCGFMLVGMSVFDTAEAEARVFQGIITGIGFIGGGAILNDKDKVTGVSSATSIWNTGAIGLAVAFGRLEVAVVLAILNVFTLFVFGKVKDVVDHNGGD